MSIWLQFLDSHLDLRKSYDFSEEQGQQFHQDFKLWKQVTNGDGM